MYPSFHDQVQAHPLRRSLCLGLCRAPERTRQVYGSFSLLCPNTTNGAPHSIEKEPLGLLCYVLWQILIMYTSCEVSKILGYLYSYFSKATLCFPHDPSFLATVSW
jgi:hypothetical protein